MAQHARTTFTRAHEVIEHGIDHLKRVCSVLERLKEGEPTERVRMLMVSADVDLRNLLGAMERLLEDLPDKVRDTYAQYTVELPAAVDPPDGPLTTLSLIQWLQHHNGALQETFAELADTEGGETGEVFRGLADQLDGHGRRLSREYQRLEDL